MSSASMPGMATRVSCGEDRKRGLGEGYGRRCFRDPVIHLPRIGRGERKRGGDGRWSGSIGIHTCQKCKVSEVGEAPDRWGPPIRERERGGRDAGEGTSCWSVRGSALGPTGRGTRVRREAGGKEVGLGPWWEGEGATETERERRLWAWVSAKKTEERVFILFLFL